MIEQNPYETQRPVDIPSFQKKDDVDLSVFKLTDEQIGGEPQKPSKKKKNNNFVLLIVTAVAVIIAVVSLIVCLSSNKARKAAEENATKLKDSYDSQVTRYNELNDKYDAIVKENETLKKENEELKAGGKPSSGDNENAKPSSGGTLSAGKYRVEADMNVRIGPGTSYDVVDVDTLPTNIQQLLYDNGVIEKGVTVNILEVKTSSGMTWGKIADSAWFCVDDGTYRYVTAQ